MPSSQALPTIQDLIAVSSDGILGSREPRADVRSGSGYNLLEGPAAILFSREGQRDRDLFRAVYNDTADGDDLSARLNTLYGYPRAIDSYGTGFATIYRPTAAGGAGTLFAGSRIVVATSSTEPRIYAITADTPVGAAALSVTVPIRATTYGAGFAINAFAPALTMRFDDTAFDATLTPQSVQCGDGSTFEQAAAYRARVRQGRLNSRVGYVSAIIQALTNVGAVNVALYASNFAGDANDYGLNVVYVGDAGYSTSAALLNLAAQTLESYRVLGCDLQVLPMTSAVLPVTLSVSLWQDPGAFNLTDITTAITAALIGYFDGRKNSFQYQLDAMQGAVAKASSAIQSVAVSLPSASVGVTSMLNGIPQWPATLTRYVLSTSQIQLSFTGPQ